MNMCSLLLNGEGTGKEYSVRSLAKALHVRERFTLQEPELGATEISRRPDMDLTRYTTQALCDPAALEEELATIRARLCCR